MKTEHQAQNTAGASVQRVLTQAGDELRDLSSDLELIEEIIGPAIVKAAREDRTLLRQIQEIDHIQQKLRALGEFLSGLAFAAPEAWRIDAKEAARSLTLADLAVRLTDCSRGGEGGEMDDLELF